jgi:hypothetical protein
MTIEKRQAQEQAGARRSCSGESWRARRGSGTRIKARDTMVALKVSFQSPAPKSLCDPSLVRVLLKVRPHPPQR